MIFGQKMGQNPHRSIVSVKFDNVTVTLSLIVLSRILCYKLILILSYLLPKFVKVECHLHAQKNRSTFAQWGMGGGVVATPQHPPFV